MDPKEQNPQETTGSIPTPPTPDEKSAGPLIGIVVVVALLVLGAIYFWYDRYINDTPQDMDQMSAEEINEEHDAVVGNLEAQGTSDDIASIEADLEASNFDDLDADFDAIESELNVQ